jgi:ankyrin repeat protein
MAEDLLLAIAKLPQNVSHAELESSLFPILRRIKAEQGHAGTEHSADGVTPLMVACDKGQIVTVRFLLEQRRIEEHSLGANLFGDIFQKCADSGNTAIHHAAMAGKVEIVEQLRLNLPENTNQEDRQAFDSVQNAHGDTPIMMACANGCCELLEHWLPRIDGRTSVLQIRNKSNDSAISLACGHGHSNILAQLLRWATRDSGCIVEPDDLVIAQASLSRLNAFLEKQQRLPSSTVQQIQHKRKNIELCVNLVRDSLQQKADAVAQELTAEEAFKKVNKNNLKQRITQRQQPQSPCQNQEPCLAQTAKDHVSRDEDQHDFILTQLKDGTRAVAVQGKALDEEAEKADSKEAESAGHSLPQKSADDLFRDQFLEGAEIKDVMQALCLDVSQLLLTPHGMALNLSASQLDAVDRILERQRAAVKEARAIQSRLHHPDNVIS